MGADFAYIGSAFIATHEARAIEAYKQMIVESTAEDIVYTKVITGVHGNYLKQSLRRAGLNPENLSSAEVSEMSFGGDRSDGAGRIFGARVRALARSRSCSRPRRSLPGSGGNIVPPAHGSATAPRC